MRMSTETMMAVIAVAFFGMIAVGMYSESQERIAAMKYNSCNKDVND